MTKLLTVLTAILLLCAGPTGAKGKPFQKALVLGGGGITPAVALGMIAGAEAEGYDPDVIIASCGSSLGAALYSSFPTPQAALKYAKSEKFYRLLQKMVKLNSWTVFGLQKKFNDTVQHPDLLPAIFDGTILSIPTDALTLLPNENFPVYKNKPRLIIMAARASFGPQHQGHDSGRNPLFRESFITDTNTAYYLSGFPSPIQKSFPYGRVDSRTEVLTGIPLSMAVRASISDPYYINPAKIGKNYYWGGAVDLFPVETAKHLAQEVLMNFPVGLYSAYEDLAISSTYGFAQSDRTTEVSQLTDIKWIDSSGTSKLAMDPTLLGLLFVNKFPSNPEKFAEIIHRQYIFGFKRAQEAARLQKNKVNVRTHLRNTEVGIR